MPAPPCNHPRVLDRISIYGSRLVLCQYCWEAIDPSPRPESAPPASIAKESPPSKPAALRTSTPQPAPALPEELRELPTVLRYDLRFMRGFGKILILLIGFSAAIYAALLVGLEHPRFYPFRSPDNGYSLEFPSASISHFIEPSQKVSGAEARRNSIWMRETYRIQVSPAQLSATSRAQLSLILRTRDFESTGAVLVNDYFARLDPDFVRMRPDVQGVQAAAEYSIWKSSRDVVVGRVVIAGGLVYDMTVIDGNLSLDDARVQHFFNSLKPGEP